MDNFPAFMRNPLNRVDPSQEYSGVELEGYIFDGIEGSQMIAWLYPEEAESNYHTHDFDEYFVVVQGRFSGDIGGRAITLERGDECLIEAGTPHNGKYSAGSRCIFAFSKHRADRIDQV